MTYPQWAVAVVLGTVVASLAAGPFRGGALFGAALSGAAGLLSIAATGRWATRSERVVQTALVIMVLGFLGRIVLVSVGTIVVVRTELSVAGFVTAFFVVYFALAGIEGAYVQRLGRRTGLER